MRKIIKKLKEFDKKYLKKFDAGFIFGYIVGILIILYIISIFIISPLFGQGTDFLLGKTYNIVSNNWQDEKVVQSIAYLCNLQNTSIDKVYCVYNFVRTNSNFDSHHKRTNILRKPNEFFNKSVVCRDVSVLLKSIYDLMGFENKFMFDIEQHVYNKVYLDGYECKIDVAQRNFDCDDELYE